MRAIRAASAFDGTRFLDGGVTVLVEGDRIAGVEGPHHDPPDGCEVTSYDGTLLPGLVDTHVHLVADGTLGGLERTAGLSDDELDAVIAATPGPAGGRRGDHGPRPGGPWRTGHWPSATAPRPVSRAWCAPARR